MADQTPQPPQDNQGEAKTAESEEVVVETSASEPEGVVVETVASESSEETPELSYHEYLKLTNPGKSDEEIAKMIRKENRYAWLVRFQILALIVFVALIIYFIVSR